ncbi:Hypothetical predicted protein [Prunus dulcis]|uniref:Uncharacterized protein n=1 Tax=Prunus dulcis TaxID=3755 RepID=A0A5E4FNM0_PRUDU|nr:Hypothetical predicted protein [Prunus dulcis]
MLQSGHCDLDYKLLHDRVMDVFVEQLKSDIDKFKQHKLDLKPSDYITDGDEDNDDDEEEDDKDADFLLMRLQCCISKHPEATVLPAPFCCVKALRGGFSHANQINQINHINHKSGSGLGMRFWHWNRQGMFFRRQRSEVTTYLEELKKAGGRGGNLSGHGSIIKPDAMLPNEITRYVVEDGDVGEAAELQWKATVEDMYLKQ